MASFSEVLGVVAVLLPACFLRSASHGFGLENASLCRLMRFSRKALWFLALLSAICWSADGLNVSGVLLLLLMRGLYIDDALDERLDELLCSVVSPGLLGECLLVWCDPVSPVPVLLGLVTDPCPVGVSLLMLSAIEKVPGCLVPLPGFDDRLA